MVAGGSAGLLLSIFGAGMLITGRAPDATARAFRTVADAGRYHLLFGMGLVLVVVGTLVRGAVALISAVVAVVLVGIAIVRFRPRGHRQPPGDKPVTR
jgi:hypothetical protein